MPSEGLQNVNNVVLCLFLPVISVFFKEWEQNISKALVLSILHQVPMSYKIFQLSTTPEEWKSHQFHDSQSLLRSQWSNSFLLAIQLVSDCPLGAFNVWGKIFSCRYWVLFPVWPLYTNKDGPLVHFCLLFLHSPTDCERLTHAGDLLTHP